METKNKNWLTLMSDIEASLVEATSMGERSAQAFAVTVGEELRAFEDARADLVRTMAELAEKANDEVELVCAGNKMYLMSAQSIARCAREIGELRAVCDKHEDTLNQMAYLVMNMTGEEFDVWSYATRKMR